VINQDLTLRLFLVLAFLVFVPSVHAQSKCPATVGVLQEVYQNESKAHRAYLSYGEKAISENYPNIAHLFTAFAASESIHARNFKQILADLGTEVKEAEPEVRVLITKENLRHATQVELEEIDQKYPQFLEKIKPERHQAAIEKITYAWKAERQHRALIEKIKSGTGVLFGVLVSTIEKGRNRFFVCQNCGSTLLEFPQGLCPICRGPASQYREVEPLK
jgi:rubrerythrin